MAEGLDQTRGWCGGDTQLAAAGGTRHTLAHTPARCRHTHTPTLPSTHPGPPRFYTLMVLSTALFDKPAFKNLVCNGLVLAGDGKKMSKRLKNYPVRGRAGPAPVMHVGTGAAPAGMTMGGVGAGPQGSTGPRLRVA